MLVDGKVAARPPTCLLLDASNTAPPSSVTLQAEAVRSAGRVAEVECELREALGELEQHKAEAAAKFQQLQEFVMLKMQV